MATPSSRVVRSASVTWYSEAFPTMHTTSVFAASRCWRVRSSSTFPFTRRVEPKATSRELANSSSDWARSKNSSSFGLEPGQPPSM